MRTSLPAQFTEWLKACNERFARFSGSQFSSDELPQDQKPAAADSEKALTRGAICSFKCLLCGRSMRDAGERWECRCGFSYKPLVPGTIPGKYLQGAITAKKLCRDCSRVEVRGIQRYCPNCAKSRRRASNLRDKLKRRLQGDKTVSPPIAAEPLTKPKKTIGYPYPKPSIFGSSFPTGQGAATHSARERESISQPGES
jgi:hypothetical protein